MLTSWTRARCPTVRERCLVSSIAVAWCGRFSIWSDERAHATAPSRSFDIAVLVVTGFLSTECACELGGGDPTINQNGGGGGCDGFGPNARDGSRCGRFTLDIASCRAYSWSPISLYCGLVSEATNATTLSISSSESSGAPATIAAFMALPPTRRAVTAEAREA